MALLDPKDRTNRGLATQALVTGRAAPEPRSLQQSTWRDFIFAEVWNRPGLDRRARFLIGMAGAAVGDASDAVLDDYVRGALTTGELTIAELREGAVHLAVYAGWGRGDRLDASIGRVADALGIEEDPFTPVRSAPWDPDERLATGAAEFLNVMVSPGPQPTQPYYVGGILGFVFGEMWGRPGLDQRARRWITLVGVCHASVPVPIDSHVHAAMASGNCTEEEIQEFVLQFAVHSGWPKASNLPNVVARMAERVRNGQPWHG